MSAVAMKSLCGEHAIHRMAYKWREDLMPAKSGVAKRREEIRQEYWPHEDLWTGEREIGWFSVPRSLPLVLALLSSKEISGGKDPSFVYLELLSRQRGEGVIEMGTRPTTHSHLDTMAAVPSEPGRSGYKFLKKPASSAR